MAEYHTNKVALSTRLKEDAHFFALCLTHKQSVDESVKIKIAMSTFSSLSKKGPYYNHYGSSMHHSLKMECDYLQEMLILIEAPVTDWMGCYS